MKSALLKRLKRLEEVQAIEGVPPVEFQTGYLNELPPEYTGSGVPGRYWDRGKVLFVVMVSRCLYVTKPK